MRHAMGAGGYCILNNVAVFGQYCRFAEGIDEN
jgi:acetoin utilization deacetylase AcuC-like enzyme